MQLTATLTPTHDPLTGETTVFYRWRSSDPVAKKRDLSDTLLDFCQAATETSIQEKAVTRVRSTDEGLYITYQAWDKASIASRTFTEFYAKAAAASDFANTYMKPGASFVVNTSGDLLGVTRSIGDALLAVPGAAKKLIEAAPMWLPFAMVGVGLAWVAFATRPWEKRA